MSSDAMLRAKIREAVIRQATAVGLGLTCPHCGGGLAGGDWQSDIRDAFNPQKNGLNASIADTGQKIKHEFTDQNSLLGQAARKVKHEFVDKESILRAKILPAAAKVGTFLAPAINMVAPGVGTAISTGLNTAERVNQGAKSVGLGLKNDGRKGRWSPEARERARQRAADPQSHASKVKVYMRKHPSSTLAEASRACAK